MATTKKKVTKKKTKKKIKKKAVGATPVAAPAMPAAAPEDLDIRISSEFREEIIALQGAFKLADEATVLFRGLALLKEVVRRRGLGYDLCFVERTTKKVVSVDFGA
jgi:hypothetical protein